LRLAGVASLRCQSRCGPFEFRWRRAVGNGAVRGSTHATNHDFVESKHLGVRQPTIIAVTLGERERSASAGEIQCAETRGWPALLQSWLLRAWIGFGLSRYEKKSRSSDSLGEVNRRVGRDSSERSRRIYVP
jgi:hypothetical protein